MPSNPLFFDGRQQSFSGALRKFLTVAAERSITTTSVKLEAHLVYGVVPYPRGAVAINAFFSKDVMDNEFNFEDVNHVLQSLMAGLYVDDLNESHQQLIKATLHEVLCKAVISACIKAATEVQRERFRKEAASFATFLAIVSASPDLVARAHSALAECRQRLMHGVSGNSAVMG